MSRKLSLEITRNNFDTLSPKHMKVPAKSEFTIKSIKELNQNKSIEQISLVLQCDPTREGNRDICLEHENNCQAQPKHSDIKVANTVNANCQAQLPAEHYVPTKEGLAGFQKELKAPVKQSPKLDPNLASDTIKGNSKTSMGAIPKKPKIPLRAPLEPKSENNSESKILFSKMRSKNEAKTDKKSPEKTCKGSPTKSKKSPKSPSPSKLLSKYNRSPKKIMRDLKLKIEGNRVRNLVRALESRNLPGSPKSAKKKSFGSIKMSDKKSSRSKRKPLTTPNQPKIDSFFGKESSS